MKTEKTIITTARLVSDNLCRVYSHTDPKFFMSDMKLGDDNDKGDTKSVTST